MFLCLKICYHKCITYFYLLSELNVLSMRRNLLCSSFWIIVLEFEVQGSVVLLIFFTPNTRLADASHSLHLFSVVGLSHGCSVFAFWKIVSTFVKFSTKNYSYLNFGFAVFLCQHYFSITLCTFITNSRNFKVSYLIYWIICLFLGGVLSNSLAIATDAAHLLTDFAAFMISLFALWVSSRKPTQSMPFGWYRAEVIGALASVLTIWVVTGILVYLAVERIVYKQFEIDAKLMLITSAFGILVNLM